jgi:large subunit ribosomal protein L10
MNRDEKSAVIAKIAGNINESDAIFAVDYRGITVAQVAELRSKLREADASFTVVKNSLTERAADQAGAEALKEHLTGPTALTFVRGDAAVAAKTIADFTKATQLLPFKGGLMEGDPLDAKQIGALSKLPSRQVLYGQLVGIVASPITGVVRTLNALLGGLAVALGQVNQKKESGEIPSGTSAPAEPAAEAPAEADAPAEAAAEPATEADAPADAEPEVEAEAEAAAEPEASEEPAAEATADDKTEPVDEPAADDNQADVSAEAESDDAETTPTKED